MPITWEQIRQYVEGRAGLTGRAARDFCALECLANEPTYAKTDSQKVFLLWEVAKTEAIEINASPDCMEKHPWVHSLFVVQRGRTTFVRFPFNTWDTDPDQSLSGKSIEIVPKWVYQNGYLLPRWSTASRSCLVMIPETIAQLDRMAVSDSTWDKLKPDRPRTGEKLNLSEWQPFILSPAEAPARFFRLGISPGKAAQGVELSIGKYRLYSVKTGVQYVGSKDESNFGKNLLERNCVLALARSNVIANMANNDGTFGVQTEVLTVTAPTIMRDATGQIIRDGFQVRDLSCLKPGHDYIPGQAIPYARDYFDREAFDHEPTAEEQCDFWRKNFAVPLGRAKARLFLNYGLIHTSANAQNFLLGFTGSTLEQFVARDIGDTSWHDDYINKYFRDASLPKVNFNREFRDSMRKDERTAFHLLRTSHSTDYPPPRMIRLDAYSVLTHDFAEKLKTKHRWTDAQVYKFATGILDGFRQFMQEALGLTWPDRTGVPPLSDVELATDGFYGKYPPPKSRKPVVPPEPPGPVTDYVSCVTEVLKKDAKTLFHWARAVRECGEDPDPTNTARLNAVFRRYGDDRISILINAEEILLCAGLEKLLVMAEGAELDRIHKLLNSRFSSGKWPPIVK